MLTHTHERSNVVNLKDENIVGFQGALGVVAQASVFRLAVEHNLSATSTFSFRFGAVIDLKPRKKEQPKAH
jgi:hypothetical protein